MLRVEKRQDGGFTLVELLVTMTIAAVLMGIAAPTFARWSAATAHKGARDEVISALRNVAQRSLSEGRTYCVHFGTDGSWSTYRRACSTSTGQLMSSGRRVESAQETITPSFTYVAAATSTCPSPGRCAYFYPRGTASPGTVVLSRTGQPTYTVRVEQLTSRVYAN